MLGMRRTGRDGIPAFDYLMVFSLFRLAAIIHGIALRLPILGVLASIGAAKLPAVRRPSGSRRRGRKMRTRSPRESWDVRGEYSSATVATVRNHSRDPVAETPPRRFDKIVTAMLLRRRLIIAFLLLSVVPLTAVTLFSYAASVNAVENAARQEATEGAADISRRMEQITADVGRRMDRIFEFETPMPAAAATSGSGVADADACFALEGAVSEAGGAEPEGLHA